MIVSCRLAAQAPYPLPVGGAHALAWTYILDWIFSDAYHAKVRHLECHLGWAHLDHELSLRGSLSGPGRGSAIAVAWLGASGALSKRASRLYVVHSRCIAPGEPGWSLRGHYFIYTWGSRLWGIPIRLATWAGRPDWDDRMMYRMRRGFIAPHRAPCRYQLAIWNKVAT